MGGAYFNAEFISAGLDMVSAALTVAYLGCIAFGTPPSEGRWWGISWCGKRSLRGQHVMPRVR